MKINWAKVGIFAAGAAVGAVISSFITRNVVDKAYRKLADDEVYKAWEAAKKHREADKEKIKELEELVKRQGTTIKAQADQIRLCGGVPIEESSDSDGDETEDDIGHPVYTGDREHKSGRRESERRTYTAYSRIYDRAEAEFPMEDDVSGEEEEEMITKSGPKVISESDFSCQCLDYGKEDLHFFLADGKMLDDEGEFIDEPALLVGTDWPLHGKNAGDEVYVRNDDLRSDYRIIFTAGAGENHMDLSDDW